MKEELTNSSPLLTVVVPTYNRSSRLKNSLNNYLLCDRSDIEFIVIDNASQDDTPEVINEFLDRDTRIRYIRNPVNIGANRSIFRAFLEARSSLIMILPDDDSYTPGFIGLVVNAFSRHPNVGIVHSYLDMTQRVDAVKTVGNKNIIYKSGYDAISKIFMLSGGITGLAFRKSAIDFQLWKLDDSIYPQINISCNTALKCDVCVVASESEYVEVGGIEDTVLQRSHSRPDDYGIIERINILDNICQQLPQKEGFKLFHHQMHGLLGWGVTRLNDLYDLDKLAGEKFLYSLFQDSRVRSNPFFIILLLKSRRFRIIYYFPVLLFSNSFWSSSRFYISKLWKRILPINVMTA